MKNTVSIFLYLLVKYNYNKKKKKIPWSAKMKYLNNNSRDWGQ